MRTRAFLTAACGAAAMLAFAEPSVAGERRAGSSYQQQNYMEPIGSRYQRKRGARVKGFLTRGGGYYSYTDSDVTNVYGGSRALFGSTNSYRDPFIDRQTTAGPFDHGFFFDSGIGPRGGDAPYPH